MDRDSIEEKRLKERIREFKHCCKAYNSWKSELNEMVVQHHERVAERKKEEQLIPMHSSPSDYCDSYYDRFADDFADTMTYSSTIEGINYVDDIFHRIDKKYGSEARDVLWASYIDGEKEEAIEKRTGKTSRTFRKNATKWLRNILGEEKD